jgi:hypothetical protein
MRSGRTGSEIRRTNVEKPLTGVVPVGNVLLEAPLIHPPRSAGFLYAGIPLPLVMQTTRK